MREQNGADRNNLTRVYSPPRASATVTHSSIVLSQLGARRDSIPGCALGPNQFNRERWVMRPTADRLSKRCGPDSSIRSLARYVRDGKLKRVKNSEGQYEYAEA